MYMLQKIAVVLQEETIIISYQPGGNWDDLKDF